MSMTMMRIRPMGVCMSELFMDVGMAMAAPDRWIMRMGMMHVIVHV